MGSPRCWMVWRAAYVSGDGGLAGRAGPLVLQEARRGAVSLVDDRPARGAEGHDGHREDAQVLALDVDIQVVQQSCHARAEVRRVDLQVGDGRGEVTVLALERVDLADELPRGAHRPEDAVLLA